MKLLKWAVLLVIVLGIVYGIYLLIDSKSDKNITDFTSCARKYPVMESYPARCMTKDGRSFTQPINNSDEITRIAAKTCPDPEFEGQGDGVLYLKGKKYYTEEEDWNWIVNNCADYVKYK